MAGTDKPGGSRPTYTGPKMGINHSDDLMIDDTLVYNFPNGSILMVKTEGMKPRTQNADGTWTPTFHQQGLDKLKEQYGGNLEGLGGEMFNEKNIESAGAIKDGEVKTQSCTVNNLEQNRNYGNDGQIREDARQGFIDQVLQTTEDTRTPVEGKVRPGYEALKCCGISH